MKHVLRKARSVSLKDNNEFLEEEELENKNLNEKTVVIAIGQNVRAKYSGRWYPGHVTMRHPEGVKGIYSIKFKNSRSILKVSRADIQVLRPIIEVPTKEAAAFLSKCKLRVHGAARPPKFSGPAKDSPNSSDSMDAKCSPDAKANATAVSTEKTKPNPSWVADAFNEDIFADATPPPKSSGPVKDSPNSSGSTDTKRSPDAKTNTTAVSPEKRKSNPSWAANAFDEDFFATAETLIDVATADPGNGDAADVYDPFNRAMSPIPITNQLSHDSAQLPKPKAPQRVTPQLVNMQQRQSRKRATSSPQPLVKERVIAIVGVENGLALAVAKYFIDTGFAVVLMAESKEKLKPVHEKIIAIGGKVRSIIMNPSEGERVSGAFAQLKKGGWLSRITVLFYNADSSLPSPFPSLSAENFCKRWRASTLGAFLTTQQILPVMLRNDGGTVFFRGHPMSLRGEAGHAATSVSSSGVRSLSQSLAAEYGPQGIHVVHVILNGNVQSIPSLEMALKPEAIAATLYSLHMQDRSVWTSELELRSF